MGKIIGFNVGAILCGAFMLWQSFNPFMLAWVAANIGACIVAIIAVCSSNASNQSEERSDDSLK